MGPIRRGEEIGMEDGFGVVDEGEHFETDFGQVVSLGSIIIIRLINYDY